ncbi:MAG: glycerophosphodiester phosphodiesterase [Rhodoferax sp.]|uniref:glycerophosphodiester phosphodiesterase n=1 Tax=Rhodoferax sp. TaxID=50421 RepID=UPI001B49617E|nr:glycerophosphodiester phosphodiesterase [Rhodoferax sp.]MBP9905407.1 glycerophosphodiester phosphodiesterase [Rhodoferax sp.]
MSSAVSLGKPWPYPRWVAHRGAGKLAPENTLTAFRCGAAHGYRMFECDVKLSADGVPFLLHDDTLTRTTNATEALGAGLSAVAGEHPWSTLSLLDAGSWHSRTHVGEPLPTFESIARFCRQNAFDLNIEIKPSPGTDDHTGQVVAQHAARLWHGADVPPLLTSFSVSSLEGALRTQPELPRGLLLEGLWDGWLETAQRLGCVAVVCDHVLWKAESVALARGAGLRTLSYTVNDAADAQRLWALGTDGIITDRVDLFPPGA